MRLNDTFADRFCTERHIASENFEAVLFHELLPPLSRPLARAAMFLDDTRSPMKKLSSGRYERPTTEPALRRNSSASRTTTNMSAQLGRVSSASEYPAFVQENRRRSLMTNPRFQSFLNPKRQRSIQSTAESGLAFGSVPETILKFCFSPASA